MKKFFLLTLFLLAACIIPSVTSEELAVTQTAYIEDSNIRKTQAAQEFKPTAIPSTSTPASRCIPATTEQLTFIRVGVQAVQLSNDIGNGFAVKSGDFQNVYFVAAKIFGESLPKDGYGPGVWAVSGDPINPSGIIAVNGEALAFSAWEDVLDINLTMNDDGARDAEECTK